MICRRCGTENPDAAKFCLECGGALAAETRRAAREERKVVSVLFADLVGFTSQAEQMDPEEVRGILQPYHASVRGELERFGGTVEKFIGDAVMALFGAPVAHEDDPERAVRAALAIREALTADGRLHVRIGITTGEALVALEARPESGEGMAAGDVVNTAARLQSVAPVDGILVDETTYRATSRRIEYRDHEPLSVNGKAELIPVREAVAARARFGVDVRQIGHAPLVGRERELALLTGALDRAMSEREPQLVTVVGVPGIGKSRLVWELFQHIERGDQLIQWRQGRSLPYAEGVSYWALGEMVKAEAGLLETDTADSAASKLSKAVAALGAEASDAEWMERHLRPLVGLEADTEMHGDRRGEAFAAWRRFLEALAEQRPLVLIFEDLHWADDGLLDFVDHLVDWATGVPLLIVGTSRPELLGRRQGWGGGKPNALTLSLSPLTDAETARLVGTLVERAVIPDDVRENVLDRAQGNPLYAEEFARLVAERGRLDDLPGSVQGIIAARLDGLAREDKELLQHASVVGKVFWSGALAAMDGRPRSEVEERLHRLERREFVRRERRSSVAGETEYAFRHILVRDVAYGQIPRAERAERHVKAAEWIDSLGRPADHAELLAQHYLAAMELARAAGRATDSYAERARPALAYAGERALTLNAFAASTRYLRAAIYRPDRDDPTRPMLLYRYGKALRISDERGSDVLAEAEASLRRGGDLEHAAEAAVLQAELAWFAGDGVRHAEHLERSAAMVDALPASHSKAFVLSDLSRFHMLAAESEKAVAVGRRALAIADELGLDDIRVHALNNVGTARFNLGDHGGIADLDAAIEIGRRINTPDVARAMNNLGSVLASLGDLRRSRTLFQESLELGSQLGNAAVSRFARAVVPMLDYDVGEWDDALPALDAFIADVEHGQSHVQESSVRAVRARIRYARSDVPGALDDAERGLIAARRGGDPQGLGPALVMGAWLKARIGDMSQAVALAQEVVDLIARTRVDLGAVELVTVLDRIGRRDDVAHVVAPAHHGRWHDLFAAFGAARVGEAAGIADEMGGPPHAALLRLHAAEHLVREGRREDARAELEKAAAFWRTVRATELLREADELLAVAAR